MNMKKKLKKSISSHQRIAKSGQHICLRPISVPGSNRAYAAASLHIIKSEEVQKLKTDQVCNQPTRDRFHAQY
eukprot:545970-Rhodomonas_salina.1